MKQKNKPIYDLDGKVVFITGAAGGIGAAVARALHAAGARLVLTDTNPAQMEQLAAGFDADRTLALTLDITDAAATRAVVARAVERFGRIDIAFANAGISWSNGPQTLLSCDEPEFERIVEVNLLGVWRTIKAALPEVLRNQGQIVVTSSIYAFMNGMCNAPYATSKAGIEMLARSLRAELGSTGASASVLYPGCVETAIAKMAFGGNKVATKMVRVAYPVSLRQPIPPETVAAAMIDGLRTRRARIIVPGRWTPVSWLRGIVSIVTDRRIETQPKLQALMRDIERAPK